MRKLVIKDVGPITKTAEIVFNRFCILIGPQSNGKSTIAKILSTCLWLEKEACTSLEVDASLGGDYFKRSIEDFHRIHNYIHPDRSYIEYASPFIRIVYDKGKFTMSFVDNLSYNRLKISYMPSDRNTVTMKDIEKRDLESTNFRSFLFDWLGAKRNYDVRHKIPILDLNTQYYFDDQANDNKDMLAHENGITYSIPLYDASSGMQSLVPMTVLMHYLSTDYFQNYGKSSSFEQQQKENNRAGAIARMITTKYYPEEVKQKGYFEVYLKISKKKEHDKTASQQMDEMVNLYSQLSTPKSISFILEEPEQNLFPQTQVSLFNDIIDLCSNDNHPSSAFITTHSPYLLASANILLFMGKLIALGVDLHELQRLSGMSAFINRDDFSAYSVSGGTCVSIVDEETGLIKENELDSASEFNADIFEKLYDVLAKTIQA